jgi:putative flavoprotein involved in K+ transport
VLLVDAQARVGEPLHGRWDSLLLFTPRDLDGLPGLPFPRGDDPFSNKDEVADYQVPSARETRFPLRLDQGSLDTDRRGSSAPISTGRFLLHRRNSGGSRMEVFSPVRAREQAG